MPSTFLNVTRIINIVFVVLCFSACTPQNTKEVSAKEVSLESSGSYTDSSGLTWTRCPLGMSWSQSTCEGTATLYTFDEAKNIAQQLNARLPSLFEYQKLYKQDMSSIMPINCKGAEAEITEERTDFHIGSDGLSKKEATKTYKRIDGEKQCKYWTDSHGMVDVFRVYNDKTTPLANKVSKNSRHPVMLVH